MARIHVFAIDWVPERTDVANGGGLRSRQIVEALRHGGHCVSYSVPENSVAVQAMRLTDPDRLRDIALYNQDNQIELVRHFKPDLVAWLWPTARKIPFSGLGDVVHLCDLNGLQHYEWANGSPRLLPRAREMLLASVRGADIALTGSAEQYGYWLALLGELPNAPSLVLAGYALPPALTGPVATEPSALRRLHFTGNLHPWSLSPPLLLRCAKWAEARADIPLRIVGSADLAGPSALSDLRALEGLEQSRAVAITPKATFAEALADYTPGGLFLDLANPGVERQLAVPVRVVNALSCGLPMITTTDSPLTRRLERAGAAVLIDPESPDELERTLDRIAALPPDRFGAMSAAARRFAADELAFEPAADTICQAVDQAFSRRKARIQGWRTQKPERSPIGHVLVISGEMANMRELRVDIPFSAMHRRQVISGYTVWTGGRIASTTRSHQNDITFDALWVQRSVSAEIALLLDGMDLPFAYDIDDNLLVSPSYRPPFTPEDLQAARNFVRRATVVTCATARLAMLLQQYATAPVVEKAVVAQNILRIAPRPRPVGEPDCVIWASSDTPALTAQGSEVIRAVRDFCLTYKLRLVCIGAQPPGLIAETDIEIEHIGLLPYHAYLDLLRSLAPAIMVCPMDIESDPATQDFVDGKSDIKILDALFGGVVGVFSASRAYTESDLPRPILCNNNYRSWLDGLTRARHTLMSPPGELAISPFRIASDLGTMPYVDALMRVRLPHPVRLAEFTDRLRLMRSRLGRRMLGPEEFDEAFYLAKYPDVQLALEQGAIVSAYDHYVSAGFSEHREGRENDHATGRGEQWWVNLLHTLGDLRTSTENRTPQIEELKRRRAMRVALRNER